tara:strand:+ start:9260 stop:10252 length:993 start_codon:yes stop_codon:yes gene_type:complete
MLEQAIIDAQALREVALKNAEMLVIEKYSDEVKTAVNKLLEQDPLDDLSMDTSLDGDEQGVESDVMGGIPSAQDPSLEDEEVVVLDLDQLITAHEEEEEAGEDEDISLGADEIADDIGIEMTDDMPANRKDEEIELDEEALVDVFKEMLVVDLPEAAIEISEEMAEDEKEEEETVVVSSSADDGMDKKDIEAHERSTARLEMESLTNENKQLKNILVKVKDRLEEINLSNARLLYTNRVLQDTSLNEQQKNKIAEMVSNARSVEEAKLVFETLQKTLAGPSVTRPQKSLSEVVTRSSSVILSGRRKTETTDDGNPVLNRWATLAGLSNKD